MIGFHIPQRKTFLESIQYYHEHSNGIKHFQIFTKSPMRSYIGKIDERDGNITREYIRENEIQLYTHASYMLNMSNPDKWEMKLNMGKNELDMAENIGALGTVFHVGKHLKLTKEEGENLMYEYIKYMMEYIRERGYRVKYIIETSARCGTELLWSMEDLGRFYRRFTEEEREYIKICIDTCHIFSAGYRIHTRDGCEEYIEKVREHIGWENVVLIHLNDSLSLSGCGCKLDRHANIMKGFIRNGMKRLIEYTIENGISHVLETPDTKDNLIETHLEEIQHIYSWFS
jgi:deoxyribonuclease-4